MSQSLKSAGGLSVPGSTEQADQVGQAKRRFIVSDDVLLVWCEQLFDAQAHLQGLCATLEAFSDEHLDTSEELTMMLRQARGVERMVARAASDIFGADGSLEAVQ